MQQSISWGSWAAVGAVLSQLACREVPWPPDGEGGAGGEAGEGAGGIGGTLMIDPVLGCSAEAWPARAAIELLPHPDFADSFGWEVARAISADGAVVIGDYRVAELVVLDDIAGRRALQFRSGTWEWVDPAAQGIATVVSCDGGLIAGRLDDYRAFFKTSGEPLVTITPEEPIWSAEPEDSSADGTRIAGNLRYADRMLNRGPTTPAVWTNAGEPTYFESEWPRSLFHVRFDGLLFAGASNGCSSGMFCPGPEDLFLSTGPGNETAYEDMPWSIASADLTTFSGYLVAPPYQNDETVVHLFRPPAQYDVLPCPNDSCVAVALSSHGTVLLVNSVSSPYVWTAEHGFRSLTGLLALDGIDLEGANLSAVDMSDDGRVITGQISRTNDAGDWESNVYRAYLPLRTYE